MDLYWEAVARLTLNELRQHPELAEEPEDRSIMLVLEDTTWSRQSPWDKRMLVAIIQATAKVLQL